MNTVLWVLAGGVAGWLAFTQLHFNEGRSKFVSIIIGISGGFLGGKLLAPMFGDSPLAGAFSMQSLIVALISAGACLYIASKVHDRFGV